MSKRLNTSSRYGSYTLEKGKSVVCKKWLIREERKMGKLWAKRSVSMTLHNFVDFPVCHNRAVVGGYCTCKCLVPPPLICGAVIMMYLYHYLPSKFKYKPEQLEHSFLIFFLKALMMD
ncbi:unnamed protein product [Brugia timori]|uniref:Ovule protein n=1 Tax=Brugia timori TaxID=42155 RepID=A0A0R3QY91_9BILA|nr:unnamed protein product [Brugia timori]